MGVKLAWDSDKHLEKASATYVRERSSELYHTYRWTKLSSSFRKEPENCLCAICKSKGIIRLANVVDHITPWPICGKDGFYDRSNLQALCEDCNREKGNRDKKKIAEWRMNNKQ